MFGAPASKPSLFGNGFGSSIQNNTGQQQPQQQNQPHQQQTGLFGQSQAQQQQQQQQPQQQGLFGTTNGPTPQQAANLIVSQLGSSQFNAQLGSSQAAPLPKLGQSSIWEPPQPGPRDKSVTDQVTTLFEKWHHDHPECLFQHYFYNNVDVRAVPFYTPGPGENEQKWEEALSKKPTEGSIPVLARGFKAVANRMAAQSKTVAALQVRLHEINNSLNMMLQKHELEWTVKLADAKRRHIALSQRALALATKVQVLRNRGYAMESTEEEFKKKLLDLEKQAFDPVMNGRREEIWAKLSALRKQAQWLQAESEKLGAAQDSAGDGIEPEKMKQIEKILKDYKSQLDHLEKEVGTLKSEFEEWQGNSVPTANGVNGRR